ncbi:MAG: hypothetical protein C3F12_07650 [Candidatus Methylomirabilota bacterium]|nr:hypothetical protein [Candidatus Methylomirabilis sp.]PWB45938.1 MAG: hypothetical protein C3F12_07650 [candidate division NC10 bacterium]
MNSKLVTGYEGVSQSEPDIAGGTIKIGFIGKGHPISIFTWIGGRTAKLDIWDNQGKLRQCAGDTEEVHLFPDTESLSKLENCTVGYIHNHGGVLTTGVHSDRVDIRVAGLGFPKDEHTGPSVILYVGCQTGKEKYAAGFGILPQSRTKVFVGFNFDATMAGFGSDSFQEAFFEAFGSGCTVDEACRRGYDVIKKKESPVPFKEMISIIGNSQLTLRQVRDSLDKRDIFHKKQREADGKHLCGAACKDFKNYGFCDRPVRGAGQMCWQH